MSKAVVYAICKNEAKHVARFMASCKGADAVIVSDTGSTDGTDKLLREAGAEVHDITGEDIFIDEAKTRIRFDHARNKSLELVPKDFDWCSCLDIDEVLVPGWRENLDRLSCEKPAVNRLWYHYVWGWKALPDYAIKPDGSLEKRSTGVPDIEFTHDKHFHKRNTHNWFLPCHERLTYIGKDGPEVMGHCNIGVDHLADPSKSRAFYLPLLELAHKEYPNDDRTAHYLGREYYFRGQWDQAIETLKHHLSLNTSWMVERAASLRFIADCYGKKGDQGQQFRYLMAACGESPGTREPWVALAEYYHAINDHLGCYYAAKKALDIKNKPNTYINNSVSWSEKPYDLAGIHAYYIGMMKESSELSHQALSMSPGDPRLQNNVRLVDMAVASGPDLNFSAVLKALTNVEQAMTLADNLDRAGHFPQALKVAKRALEINTDTGVQTLGRIYDTLANTAWRCREFATAIEYSQKAWELDKTNVDRRCRAEIYWRMGGMPEPRPSAADIPRLSIKGLPGLEELGAPDAKPDPNRRILLVYPTVRPEQAIQVLDHWEKTAAHWNRVDFILVVKTKAQEEFLCKHYKDVWTENHVMVCPEPGPAKAFNSVMQRIDYQDNPVIATTFDDLFSPVGWDDWLSSVFGAWDGAILINYQCPAALVGVPMLSYNCLLKLNRVPAHPSYYAQYSDTELFENLYELRLLRNYQGEKNPVFEHRHWLHRQRTQDNTDVAMLQNGGTDQRNFYRRMMLPVAERLKV